MPPKNQIQLRERCRKKKIEKKLTNVSFAFTHTYTPVKTNIFRFFPQAYMENFEKCAKTQKQKTICCPMLSVVVFSPSFFWEPFPNVILISQKSLHYVYHQNTGVIR